MRISEAPPVTPADLSRQLLCFQPAKSSSTAPCWRPLSFFLEDWSAYLHNNSEVDSPFDLLGAQVYLTLLHPRAARLTLHIFRRVPSRFLPLRPWLFLFTAFVYSYHIRIMFRSYYVSINRHFLSEKGVSIIQVPIRRTCPVVKGRNSTQAPGRFQRRAMSQKALLYGTWD